jgi:hypothetical protein
MANAAEMITKAASPAAEGAAHSTSFPDIIINLLRSGQWGWLIVIAGILVIQWLAIKTYEQLNASWTVRRSFVEATTQSVAGLATTHYWALANASGTLATLLLRYVRMIEAHCFINYHDKSGLSQRLDELTTEAANLTFAPFARLVILFDRFQFRGSNTYLLPDHESGETLRRLYNAFVSNLPETELLILIRKGVEKQLLNEAKPAVADPVGLNGTFLEDLPNPDMHPELSEAHEKWRTWLRDALPKVSGAAEALIAYSELLSHELAVLNAVFFRDRPGIVARLRGKIVDAYRPAWWPIANAWAAETWPSLLSTHAVAAAARASALPRDFAPLNSGATTQKRPDPAPQREPENRKHDLPPTSAESTSADG